VRTSATVPNTAVGMRVVGFSAGIPKPIRYRTTRKGTPRKISVYAAARKRIGKNTGPPSVRAAARSVANTATPSTATSRIRMLSHRPTMTWGRASTKYLLLKKV